MIKPREAVVNAMKFLEELYPEPVTGLRLEEVYPSEDGGHWMVTLSFAVPSENSLVAAALLGSGERRRFKRVTVEKESGEALEVRAAELS